MSNITPTPGRVVWFNPGEHDGINRNEGQPLAAIIAGVNADGTLNLAVFDASGNTQPRTNVTLVQPGDANAPVAGYAEWMPYQLGQAAKTEAVEAAAKAKTTKAKKEEK